MNKEIITYSDPKSPISEVFRTLRTNIQFTGLTKTIKTVLVTSTLPEEGKSWTSSNLAVTFAQAGKTVILVDADMRKGRIHTMFGVDSKPGLSNYLSGIDENGQETEEEIARYIKETPIDNLYIIPAGNIPPNPSELLVSEKMPELMEKLKELCDIVIFDGTPSVLVTDAVILSRIVDSTIIVTAHKTTKMDDLEKVKKSIENVGGKISGIIINKAPILQKKYDSAYYAYSAETITNRKSKKSRKLSNTITKE